ncbi:phage major capsid protein, P2 family [Burkholderia gladioli]|uniref:phage major capsid protein, P2 family n=1 Tax=Burkholderia gladioli TaxID=28095 RepID=UPI001640926B|nr:phage major capsid protein, P2 family [Burkholderia gladioli]
MLKQTQIKMTQYMSEVAAMNGLNSLSYKAGLAERFAVEPSVQQRLEKRIQESSAFLKQINIVPVTEQKGDKLGLVVGSTIASRTDTTQQDREPTDPSGLEADNYEALQTNFDTYITYKKLDMWAKFPNFKTLFGNAIVQQIALDRMMIGFNGITSAKTTDREANPRLQDVNVGWLQKYRENAARRVMDYGKQDGKIVIGKGADYTNLDALVYDAYQTLLDPWFVGSGDLVVLLGRGLLHDKKFPDMNRDNVPTEQVALNSLVAQKRVGALPALDVPFFPENSILITKLSNLSIYYQDGARRRLVIDNPKRDRIENFESSNEAYVVEDYGAGCLIENIAFGEDAEDAPAHALVLADGKGGK